MNPKPDNAANNDQPGPEPTSNPSLRRDPEDRPVASEEQIREKTMDKTLADSFPTSDPPSSIPDPCADDDAAD
jgi:hypothetical protein